MKFFKRNNDESKINNSSLTHDFILRAPFWSYRSVSYHISQKYLHYEKEIDRYFNAFKNKNCLDEFNEDFLDSIIDNLKKSEESQLQIQQSTHNDNNKNFENRRKADRKAFELHIETLIEKLEQVEFKLELVSKKYEDLNSKG